jgi:hypothetical protein
MTRLLLLLCVLASSAWAQAEGKNVLALETSWKTEAGDAVTLGALKGQW